MRVFELLHKILKKSAPSLHSKRIGALLNGVKSLLEGKRLTLTGLGRSMRGNCSPKSAIRKIDRLLGNEKLHKERHIYYEALCQKILGSLTHPLISIDWTGAPNHRHYCIRASINIKGRSFVLYEEVYERKFEKNTEINNQFLVTLKRLFPKHVTPIILTDAGFRGPWFKQISSLGWDYLGRVRNDNCYYDLEKDIWNKTYSIYDEATDKATYIGSVLLTKRSKIKCNMFLFKGKLNGRKRYTKEGKVSKRTHSQVLSKGHRDPLLVVTSLDENAYTAKQIINLYERRMEIEEEFRDLKSPRYGFSLKYSGTKSAERLQVLLLIAALGSFVCWLIALTLRRNKEHYQYQANTVRHTEVLSINFLACEAVRRLGKLLVITIKDIKMSLLEIKIYCLEADHASFKHDKF